MDYYNKHYIRTDTDSRIIYGFSDAFKQPETSDICINERGGYQFRLYPDGEENPMLTDMGGIHLYRWDGSQVVPTTPEEQEAERAAISPYIAAPTIEERTAALEAAMLDMLIGGVADA